MSELFTLRQWIEKNKDEKAKSKILTESYINNQLEFLFSPLGGPLRWAFS